MEKTSSKENIIQASLELFASKGYDGVGITEITQRAGITKPTLYYFFGSKEGLFTAVLERYFLQLNAQTKDAAVYNSTPEEYFNDVYATLKNIVLAYFAFAQENKLFYQLVLDLFSAPPSSDAARLSSVFLTEQRRILREAFASFSAVHTNIAGKETFFSWSFIAIINAAIDLWIGGEEKLSDDLAHTIVHQFMHGIYA